MHRTLIVNTLGGPGSGKSTLSYGLMAKLKTTDIKTEYVPEYAKELTYRRAFTELSNQYEVTKEQDRRLRDLLGQVTVVIHDTALPLGIIYSRPPFTESWHVRRCWELFDGYNNFNIFVKRVKKFQQYGRNQTEDEARELDKRIYDLFGPQRIDLTVDGNTSAVDIAYNAVIARLKEQETSLPV